MTTIINIARASGIFQMFIFYFGYLFTFNIDLLIFLIGNFLNWEINSFLKYKVLSPIFGKNDIPLLGKGIRPNGAKNCGWFFKKKTTYHKYPNSYGMPSGHSQGVAFFSTLGILYLLNNNKNNKNNKKIIIMIGCLILTCFTLFVMYSRVLFKCHTIEQTIVGSLIGIFLATTLFKHKTQIKTKIKKYKNYELILFIIATIVLTYIIFLK